MLQQSGCGHCAGLPSGRHGADHRFSTASRWACSQDPSEFHELRFLPGRSHDRHVKPLVGIPCFSFIVFCCPFIFEKVT